MLVASLAKTTLFLDGILAGLFVCSCLVEQAMRELSGSAWLEYKRGKERVFGAVMPGFFNLALLATIASAVIERGHYSLAAAALLLMASMIITLRVHLPLNALFQQWHAASLPADWEASRAQWRSWNWGRCLPVVLAFALVAAT